MGDIGDDATIVATVGGSGVIADGPAGFAGPLGARISAAYPESGVTDAGRADGRAGILARMMLGRSPRLVRLVPAAPCTSGCLRVGTLAVEGRFVDDPDAPGSCTRDARNEVRARLTVVDEAGRPVPGAAVRARWLDDYDLNRTVAARTNASGTLQFRHRGPACRGAIALLVESVRAPAARLDRTVGTLTAYTIPLPR